MTIQTWHNQHGVTCCDRTERTDAPEHITRMRFRGCDAVMAEDALIVTYTSAPFYRPANAFGLDDGGSAA